MPGLPRLRGCLSLNAKPDPQTKRLKKGKNGRADPHPKKKSNQILKKERKKEKKRVKRGKSDV
jgi:hypothetical protein